MAFQNEGLYTGDWLKWEQDNHYSREVITILAGSGSDRVLTSGMVLGKIEVAGATAAAFAGNTGTGAMGAITVSAGAKQGVYKLVVIEPATDAGKFTVEDPDGIIIGVGTVAVAFSAGGLAFTLADATDFVAGDGFNITVAAGSLKYVQYNQDGATGAQRAAGILMFDATAPASVDADAVAIVRDAIVNANQITWPSDIDPGEKATAVAQLEALGIRVREGA